MLLIAYAVERIMQLVFWAAEITEQFEQWWDGLDEDERVSIDGMIRVLEQHGPTLTQPYSSETGGSRYPRVRQLRVPHQATQICVLYVPDDERLVFVLLTGTTATDEHGDCPQDALELADAIYERYLTRRAQRH